MSLQKIMKEEHDAMIRKYGGHPVPQEIWEKYQKEMAENRERMVE